ncbi:MAG: hypothetical protein V1921_04470 [Candidatus Altiarchaeota archaeon]
MLKVVQPPGEPPLPDEMPNFKPKKSTVVNVEGIRAEVVRRKSDYPGYVRADITFNDIYQSDLFENHGWTEEQVRSFDTQLASKLKGMKANVEWEDKELFHVDVPATATRDAVSDVAEAVKSLIQKPLTDVEIKGAADEVKAAAEAAKESLTRMMSETSSKENLFQAYKDPNPEKTWEHNGYCAVKRTTFAKAGGIGYEDGEFLGREYRRTATKKGMCILDISLSGEPFHCLYGGREIVEGRFGFPEQYSSELLGIVSGMAAPGEVVKSQAQISARKGSLADGEHVKLLCTKDFSEKVVTSLKARYSDLQDTAQQKR